MTAATKPTKAQLFCNLLVCSPSFTLADTIKALDEIGMHPREITVGDIVQANGTPTSGVADLRVLTRLNAARQWAADLPPSAGDILGELDHAIALLTRQTRVSITKKTKKPKKTKAKKTASANGPTTFGGAVAQTLAAIHTLSAKAPNGFVRAESISAVTRLDPKVTRRVLATLIKQQKIGRRGQARGTEYKPLPVAEAAKSLRAKKS